MHDAVEIELASAEYHVLAGLLHLGVEQRIALVHLAQAVQHLRQLGRIHRLHGYLDHRARVEAQRAKYLRLGVIHKMIEYTCQNVNQQKINKTSAVPCRIPWDR